jgi:hypothetical protein
VSGEQGEWSALRPNAALGGNLTLMVFVSLPIAPVEPPPTGKTSPRPRTPVAHPTPNRRPRLPLRGWVPVPLKDEGGTVSRPTPVSVMDIRPGSVAGCKIGSPPLRKLSRNQRLRSVQRFRVGSFLWLVECSTGTRAVLA